MSKAYEEISQGLQEALNYEKGQDIDKIRAHQFADVDIKAIRKRLNLSQQAFAEKFCLNLRSVQNWEQKRKRPTGATLVLLRVLEKNPEAVMQALH